MLKDTNSAATHISDNLDSCLFQIGGFLSRSSLYELTQLFSVLNAYMSYIGPHHALYNQDDLIALHTWKDLDRLLPVIKG